MNGKITFTNYIILAVMRENKSLFLQRSDSNSKNICI